MRHLLTLVCWSGAAVISPAISLTAQTVDASRATAGIAAGMIWGVDLWSVENQPVASVTTAADLFTLHRKLHRDINLSGQFTFFPRPRIGIIGEFTFLGLRPDDNCTITEHHGDPSLVAACDSVRQTHVSASTTIVQGGVVVRPFTATTLQPYIKATAGVAFVPSSPAAFKSIYGHVINGETGDGTALVITIYQDPEWRPVRPAGVLAAGIATAAGFGTQLRLEARESWITLPRVIGPTSGQGYTPPTHTSTIAFFSMMVGFDIVLVKQRGRRY